MFEPPRYRPQWLGAVTIICLALHAAGVAVRRLSFYREEEARDAT